MKICVFGAGAIGGWIGARLARKADAEVSLIARGRHLAAIRQNGLTLHAGGASFTVRPLASDDPKALGPQDYLLVTLKAYALAGSVAAIRPLLSPETAIVFAQNGIPWWYFYRHGGGFEGRTLASVDPGGAIWKALGPERAIGAVVWAAAELQGPGVVVHGYGDGLSLGEPDGSLSERCRRLAMALAAAGIRAPVRPDLRSELWLKLLGNLSFNPVSVLTGATVAALIATPGTRAVVRAMMQEAKTVAGALGINLAVTLEERIDMAARIGAHRTSMLQDVEQGRPTELDALLGAVIELGRMVDVATPVCRMIYDLARCRERFRADAVLVERRG